MQTAQTPHERFVRQLRLVAPNLSSAAMEAFGWLRTPEPSAPQPGGANSRSGILQQRHRDFVTRMRMEAYNPPTTEGAIYSVCIGEEDDAPSEQEVADAFDRLYAEFAGARSGARKKVFRVRREAAGNSDES